MDMMQDLAEVVMQACPSGYSQARLEAELDEGFAEIAVYCVAESGEQLRSDLPGDTGFLLHNKLDDVREQMARQTGHRWNKCVLVILPDRRFRFNVEY
jgi:hypothetical protein